MSRFSKSDLISYKMFSILVLQAQFSNISVLKGIFLSEKLKKKTDLLIRIAEVFIIKKIQIFREKKRLLRKVNMVG